MNQLLEKKNIFADSFLVVSNGVSARVVHFGMIDNFIVDNFCNVLTNSVVPMNGRNTSNQLPMFTSVPGVCRTNHSFTEGLDLQILMQDPFI